MNVDDYIEDRLGELQRRWNVPCLRRAKVGDVIRPCRRCGHYIGLHPGNASNPAETSCLGCRMAARDA